MRILKKTLLSLLLVLTFALLANAQTDWVGEYDFGEDGGETAGGSKIYIAHTIRVSEKDGRLNAHIYSQGFQTSRDLYADVKTEGTRIMFYFREKGDDQYTGTFEKGDLLLTLEKKDTDGKTKILTYWETFKPILDSNERSGEVYFEKADEKKESADEKKSSKYPEWMRIEFSFFTFNPYSR